MRFQLHYQTFFQQLVMVNVTVFKNTFLEFNDT